MKIIRYQQVSPFSPSTGYRTLLDEVDRLFETALPKFRTSGFQTFPVDLYQANEAFVVRAELPGFRREDLGLEVADSTLKITARAVNRAAQEAKETVDPDSERSLERFISLPENADLTKISALYENGVLTVTLPKREEAKPRTIAVEVK